MNENPETKNRVPVADLAVDACSASGPNWLKTVAKQIIEIEKLRRELAEQTASHAQTVGIVSTAIMQRDDAIKALEEIEGYASGALNNAFPEEAPDILQNIHTHAKKALKALSSPNA